MPKIKGIFVATIVILLIYTRFFNIEWGLPYPFHPDELNMAAALQQLSCDKFSIFNFQFSLRECFNPHFFAYGQSPLYVGYILLQIYYFFSGSFGQSVSFSDAVIVLRSISAVASVAVVFLLVAIVRLLVQNSKKENSLLTFSFLLFTFTPVFIQFAHFGTALLYLSLLFIRKKIPLKNYVALSGLVCGLAIGTKVSSVVFLLFPGILLVKDIRTHFYSIIQLLVVTAGISILSSPHNLISSAEFYHSMQYESKVALGELAVFYTRQFEYSVPMFFQFFNIYPVALGYGILLSFIGGFLLLPKTKEFQFLRFTFLIAFLPFAFMYAKWTRFMALTFPIMVLFAVLFIFSLKDWIDGTAGNISKIKYQNILKVLPNLLYIVIIGMVCLPGLAYLSIYQNEDVRVQASRWIFVNVPDRSTILQETANVVDLPLFSPYPDVVRNESKPMPVYKSISFNFYDLDSDRGLSQISDEVVRESDYIIVPSRRVFRNHTCEEMNAGRFGLLGRLGGLGYEHDRCEKLQEKFPLLNAHYNKLFNGQLGFHMVAAFNSFPTLKIADKPVFEVHDDTAEETLSVFDHPVILIFKKQ